jgi:hypothetical protein
MKGQDKFGNEISSVSRPFSLLASTIVVQWDSVLPTTSLQEGKPFTASFVARYASGALMDDTMGKPSVALLVDGRPTKVKPDVAYQGGHWQIAWQAPDTLPKGTYVFTVGGGDFAGNAIVTSQENAVDYDPSFSNSVSKVVPHLLPGPEPLLGVALVGVLALLVRARAPRRR